MKNDDIIVIEDNDSMRLGISESLVREGYSVSVFSNGPDALTYFEKKSASIAVIDLKMEPIDGIEILNRIKKINSSTEVIMISAYGTVDDAVKAMQLGATDFLTKPFSPDELRIRVKKIFEKINKELILANLIEQNKILANELESGYEEIIGTSQAIKDIFDIVNRVAVTESSVLIYGESGTGKELIARAIHRKSLRSDMPFIKINCGALNDNLLESELFGHEKGSFTGAIKTKKGRFELADNGTLFLDEVGDISTAMQVKLLRVLQEKEFERVGGEVTISSDVRVIAATHRDLHKLISEGKFREDLFYRLNIIPVTLPPLRERKQDIPSLVNFFLNKLAVKSRCENKIIDENGIALLLSYSFPGNIRELENLVERFFVISKELLIDNALIARHLSGTANGTLNFENLPLDEALYSFEKNLIMQAMSKSGGVKNRAAKYLGIATSVLYYKLEKYGLL